MKTPLVSVIITAYNRELFISEAIESILNSTYNNIELIIVDDCSVDNTYSIAKSFEKRDTRITVYLNSSNIGDYPNRNKAAGYATGKYLKYVDSDDYIFPNTIEVMVDIMENNSTAAFGITSRKGSSICIYNSYEAYHCHFFIRGLLDYGPSSSIIRTDIFKKEKGFIELRNVSDNDFWYRIAAKYDVVEMPSGLVYCRIHGDQESKIASDLYLEYNYSIIKKYLKAKNCPLQKNEIEALLLKFRKRNSISILKYFLKTFNLKKALLYWTKNEHSIKDLFLIEKI